MKVPFFNINPFSYFQMQAPPRKAPASQAQLEGYHHLAKDTLTRAIQAEREGQTDRATRLYSKCLETVVEALNLGVPSTVEDKVGPLKSDLLRWKSELEARLITRRGTTLPASQASRVAQSNPEVPRPSQVLVTGKTHAPRAQRQVANNIPQAGPSSGDHKSPVSSGGQATETDKYRNIIMGDVLVNTPGVKWDDVVGLKLAKQSLFESVILPALRSDLFQGLRSPPRGLLLYGPPGNGKTLLAKALASEAKVTFFNISASSLTSKWVGEGEKLVRALFQVANEMQPSIIFIDEIDSILSARTANENDAMRRLKTEILIQFDGVASGNGNVVVIGATNRPQELDDAARRRLVKRIYIPLPDSEARTAIVENLFAKQPNSLSKRDIQYIVNTTEGYSASDLTALCREAAMVAIRELGSSVKSIKADKLRPVCLADIKKSLFMIRPSVTSSALTQFEEFTKEFGVQ